MPEKGAEEASSSAGGIEKATAASTLSAAHKHTEHKVAAYAARTAH